MNGLMYGEGTLEILPDGFGFLRSPDYHYLSCPDDIYVSPSQIRRFGLQTGATVSGQIRPPKENERYFALLRVEAINYQDPNLLADKVQFDDLTPLHPDTRIVMETDAEEVATRVVDLIVPIGFGQRGLIVSPPRAGKTILLQKMAKAGADQLPGGLRDHAVDRRAAGGSDRHGAGGQGPELRGDQFHLRRAVVAARAGLGNGDREGQADGRVRHDVVIFLDSITRLARAWNAECPQSGKILSGGVDANALQKPKRFFGSARKVEEGGSLTIIATALIDTGSKMDEVIFEEFKGTGNLEIVLDRKLVDRRIWPAIDINRSGTRREEMLMDPEEYRRVCVLRRVLNDMNAPDAMELLVTRLQKTQDQRRVPDEHEHERVTSPELQQVDLHAQHHCPGGDAPTRHARWRSWSRSTIATSPTSCWPEPSRRSLPRAWRTGSLTWRRVPGAWEIPLIAQRLARTGRYAARDLPGGGHAR